MTSSKAADRAARRGGEQHRDGGDPRVRQVIAARRRLLNTVRLAMALPRRPVRGSEVHARAIERLDLAIDQRKRASKQSQAAQGRSDKRTAADALAAANEQATVREAWVQYIEHGY